MAVPVCARRRPKLRSVEQQRRSSTRGSVFAADERVRLWPIHRRGSVPVLEPPAVIAGLDMSQWCVRRSRSAVVIFGSANTEGHSAKARLVVTMIDVRS